MNIDKKKSHQIWKTVGRVPKGKVASYGQIADLAGLPGRARLVGTVLRHTPESIEIPWYRILRSNGRLAFSVGSNEAIRQKQLLLDEGVLVINNRVKMQQYSWKPDLGELLMLEF